MALAVSGISMPIYSGQKRETWPIKPSFAAQLEKNVNIAIKYYEQKYKNLSTSMNSMFLSQVKNIHVQSLEELINKSADEYQKHIGDTWSIIQQTSTEDLTPQLQQLAQEATMLTNAGQNTIDFYRVLQILSNNQVTATPTQIPGVISISSFKNTLSNMLNNSSATIRSRGGSRAKVIGEIFEQGMGSFIGAHVNGLLSYVHTGHGTTTNKLPKEDGLLVPPNISYTLQGSELFDLTNKTDWWKLNSQYGNNGVLGMQMKGWLGITGNFGQFAPTANLINTIKFNQRPDGVSKWFSHKDQFQFYNAYIVSKYLTNIIGAQNALIVSATQGIQPTYNWIANLYNNGYMLRHVTQMYVDHEGGNVYGGASSKIIVASQNPRGNF